MPNVSMETTIDAEMLAFAKDVALSIQQAKRGEYAVIHTPEDIVRRSRGRPVGSVKANPKKPVQIRFDPDVMMPCASGLKPIIHQQLDIDTVFKNSSIAYI